MPWGICGGMHPSGDTLGRTLSPLDKAGFPNPHFLNPLLTIPHEHTPVLGSLGLALPVTQNPTGLPAPALPTLYRKTRPVFGGNICKTMFVSGGNMAGRLLQGYASRSFLHASPCLSPAQNRPPACLLGGNETSSAL